MICNVKSYTCPTLALSLSHTHKLLITFGLLLHSRECIWKTQFQFPVHYVDIWVHISQSGGWMMFWRERLFTLSHLPGVCWTQSSWKVLILTLERSQWLFFWIVIRKKNDLQHLKPPVVSHVWFLYETRIDQERLSRACYQSTEFLDTIHNTAWQIWSSSKERVMLIQTDLHQLEAVSVASTKHWHTVKRINIHTISYFLSYLYIV